MQRPDPNTESHPAARTKRISRPPNVNFNNEGSLVDILAAVIAYRVERCLQKLEKQAINSHGVLRFD